MLTVLLVGPFMAQADATIANVATPSIHADLGASGAMSELVIGGYLIAFAVLLITGARLGQTHGYKRLFLIGITTFSVASLLCGLAPSPAFLVGARVLQGAGAALMFPQTLTGIQLNFTAARRIRAVGLYAIALSSGAVIGQILGGALISADLFGTQWRAVFLINVPIGAAAIVAAMRFLPTDTVRESRSIDLLGVATLSASVLLLVLPLSIGRSEGWPPWTIVCLAAALPAFATFAVAQRHVAGRGGSPLVNVDAIAHPPVAWALATLLAATGTYYALLFTLAQYLQRGLGDSAVVSGLTLVPWVAAFGIAGQIVRRLPARIRGRAPAAGCLLLTLAYSGISAALFAGHHDELLLIALLSLGGLGLGLQFSSLLTHLTEVVPATYAADISGVSTTTMQIGGAVGVAAFGTLYLSLTPTTAPDATHAFAVTTAAYAAIALAATAMAHRATHAERGILPAWRNRQRLPPIAS
jgi:EmrB/QacA subfamily drug resistance transporter